MNHDNSADLSPSRPSLLINAVWPAAGANRAFRAALLAVLGTLLLWASAKVQVPFWPVPMTMQTFAVLVIAMAYGPRLGTATILVYLAEGAAGLPVFSGTPARGIGLAYMMGPTGGYLVGFAAAAFVIGYMAERGWGRTAMRSVLAMLIGTVIIYALGFVWLASVIGSAKEAFAAGIQPFLAGDALKLALAAALMRLGHHYVRGSTD